MDEHASVSADERPRFRIKRSAGGAEFGRRAGFADAARGSQYAAKTKSRSATGIQTRAECELTPRNSPLRPTFEYHYNYSIMRQHTHAVRTASGAESRRMSSRRAAGEAPIADRAQIRALAAPARQEIVDALETAGASSVAAIAALLGRPADALYHHLRRLVRVGLVRETGRARQGRHVFARYDLTRRPMRISYEPPVRSADLAAVFGAAQRLAWRDFRRTLIAGDGVRSGPRRTLWGARVTGWATPQTLKRINQILGELLVIVRSSSPEPRAVPISVSFLLSPPNIPVAGRSDAASGSSRAAKRTTRPSRRNGEQK